MMRRMNASYAVASTGSELSAMSGKRERKPAFAEPTAGSLRTFRWMDPSGFSGVGLPAVGSAEAGGGGGIRTPGGLAPTSDFKSGAFNHSATPPEARDHVAELPWEVNGADAPAV